MIRKIRVIADVPVFAECRPEVGKVYVADYSPAKFKSGCGKGEFCIVDILGKKIVLRKGEFEVLGV